MLFMFHVHLVNSDRSASCAFRCCSECASYSALYITMMLLSQQLCASVYVLQVTREAEGCRVESREQSIIHAQPCIPTFCRYLVCLLFPSFFTFPHKWSTLILFSLSPLFLTLSPSLHHSASH